MRAGSRMAGVLLALGAAAAGCDDGERDVAALDSAALAGPPTLSRDSIGRRREMIVVQVGAFADSAGAARFRDSLDAAGWTAYVRRTTGDTLPPWRVRLGATRDLPTAQLVATGFASESLIVALVSDSVATRPPAVIVQRVNRGSTGATARVRWLLGPDRQEMLVVEDAAGEDGAALPDGFMYAAEGGTVFQRDSVWDVAPSPHWDRLAYGSGYIISSGGRDSVGVRQWAEVASRTNLGVNIVRRGAFPLNSTGSSYGFVQPVVQPVAPDSLRASRVLDQVRRPAPISGGWRVRWSTDGRLVAVGLAPSDVVEDDSPVARWMGMDADGYLVRGALSSSRPVIVPDWTMGPLLDTTWKMPTGARRLEIAGGWAGSSDGWVVIQGTITDNRRIVVGPGALLAATRNGEFLAVVAPDPVARDGEQRMRAQVYRLVR